MNAAGRLAALREAASWGVICASERRSAEIDAAREDQRRVLVNAAPALETLVRAAEWLTDTPCTCDLIPAFCHLHDPAQDDLRAALAELGKALA